MMQVIHNPRPYQVTYAKELIATLSKHRIGYLGLEERTGKTLISLLALCDLKQKGEITSVLILTKKGDPIESWKEAIACFPPVEMLGIEVTLTNYHQVGKLKGPYDIFICDESHNYLSSCPKPSGIQKALRKLTRGKPIIFMSATPYPQGYQQLYHQFQLSSYSPWNIYKNFYNWFQDHGVPKTIYLPRAQRVYTEIIKEKVRESIEPLFLTGTRRELDFPFEPKDVVHFIDLAPATKRLYNTLVKDKLFRFTDGRVLACTSIAKLNHSLHMLEGGTCKIGEERLFLQNREKIDFILDNWGDTADTVIYYYYIKEKELLLRHFKNARILHATSHAEGLDLTEYARIVVYSQSWSTAKYTQLRARQATKQRATDISVHFLLVTKAISHQCYITIAENKRNFIDSLYRGDLLS